MKMETDLTTEIHAGVLSRPVNHRFYCTNRRYNPRDYNNIKR